LLQYDETGEKKKDPLVEQHKKHDVSPRLKSSILKQKHSRTRSKEDILKYKSARPAYKNDRFASNFDSDANSSYASGALMRPRASHLPPVNSMR
jgi:hypothetical protein